MERQRGCSVTREEKKEGRRGGHVHRRRGTREGAGEAPARRGMSPWEPYNEQEKGGWQLQDERELDVSARTAHHELERIRQEA